MKRGTCKVGEVERTERRRIDRVSLQQLIMVIIMKTIMDMKIMKIIIIMTLTEMMVVMLVAK